MSKEDNLEFEGEVIETLPIVQFYKKRVAELTKELNKYKKTHNSLKNHEIQEQITINIEEKKCEIIDLCGDENSFDLNKKNIHGYCISIWNAWRMGMDCHWTFSGCLFRGKKNT